MSDWSFDENCPFCCLRRDKVKVSFLVSIPDSLFGLDSTIKELLLAAHYKFLIFN